MGELPVHVALLGSSNLTLGLPHALRHLLTRFPTRPLTVFVAYGPGRSYELDRGSLGVKFRALSRCELLPAFEQVCRDNPKSDAFALLTDIGNDLMHGIPAETLALRVGEVTQRLRTAGASVAVTSLPVEGIAALSPPMFQFARRVIFPGSRTSHEDVLRGLQAIQHELRLREARTELQLLPAQREWYAPDACHLRPAKSREAMGAWLRRLLGVETPGRGGHSTSFSKGGLYLHCRPEFRLLGGHRRSHKARPFVMTPGCTVRGF